jgi:hypothetical protein
MISKTKHNDQKEQQELSDEEDYQTDNNMNKKDLLMNIVNILKMMRIKMIVH